MTIDLDELERLAKAATPGPWKHDNPVPAENGLQLADPYVSTMFDWEVVQLANGVKDGKEWDNLNFIAAANPKVVLALVARVRRLETALRGIQSDVRGAIQHAEWKAAGSKGMSAPYHGPFASGIQLPSVVKDLREINETASEALKP